MSAAVDMFRINNNNEVDCSSSGGSVKSSKDPMSITPDIGDSPLSMSFDAAATDSESGIQMTAAAQKIKSKRRKKKRLCESMSMARFKDTYYLTGDVLGEGSYGRVETCINMFTDSEYAVKLINKSDWCFSRAKVLKEVEIYYLCSGHPNIIQLVEYFEEEDYFYLVFEKANGGPLLGQIQRRLRFSEAEAAKIVRDLASALEFLHCRGIAHRDLKPENVLCIDAEAPWPIKLCDFDLCSGVHQSITTPLLQSPVGSAEYMAPEVVNAFSVPPHERDSEDNPESELNYDKRCDLWSLGVMAYCLLSGYLPFAAGRCEDPDCGWDTGDAECASCQSRLFLAICSGDVVFPEQHGWSGVSAEAKDLITRLLVRDASRRMDAEAVMTHPWIAGTTSEVFEVQVPVVHPAASSEVVSEQLLRRQTSSNVSLAWLFDRANAAVVNHNNINKNNNKKGNKNRKVSMNDRLMLAGGHGGGHGGGSLAASKKAAASRKTSMAASMMDSMRRQTSLVFPGDVDCDDLHLQRQSYHFTNLHRCEL